MPAGDSNDSNDSGVFQVPSAPLAQAAAWLPAAKPPAPKPSTAAPIDTKPSALRDESLNVATPAAIPAPHTAVPTFELNEQMSLGPATVSEVRVPKFASPPPSVNTGAPPTSMAPTSSANPAPPANVRVTLPRGIERNTGRGAQSGTRDSAPATPRGEVPDEVRVVLPSDGVRRLPFSKWKHTTRVSARKLEFPVTCPCCGQSADRSFKAEHVRTKGKRVVRSETYSWNFPYCGTCLEHVARTRHVSAIAGSAAAGAFVVIGAIGFLAGQLVIGAILAAVLGAIVFWSVRRARLTAAAREARPTCVCVGPAVRYNGFQGTVHEFEFASEEYAESFEQENARKLL